jgi:hypothetical protein
MYKHDRKQFFVSQKLYMGVYAKVDDDFESVVKVAKKFFTKKLFTKSEGISLFFIFSCILWAKVLGSVIFVH